MAIKCLSKLVFDLSKNMSSHNHSKITQKERTLVSFIVAQYISVVNIEGLP